MGYLTRTEYEYCHHIKIGRELGVSDDDIRAIGMETRGEESDSPELDRAVLRAARELTEGLKIEDKTYALLERNLDSKCLIDLVLSIAFYNCVVRVLGALEIDLEPEYSTCLDEFPLPELADK